ncbi:MAG: PAS domain-containing protein [Clostridiales bacterium]|nr:PAS domain-containing protein [Clostridiales bacterium]
MDLNLYFKSIVDSDKSMVVICNLNHEIIYMNPAAEARYARPGKISVGSSLLACHNAKSQEMIKKVVSWFEKSKKNNIMYTYYNKKENKDVYMVALRDGGGQLIGYYEKHEYRNRETAPPYDFDATIIHAP